MNEIPKATHSGTWVIDEENDIKIECYVMDNKERVLSLRGAARGIGIKGNGSQALTRNLNSILKIMLFKYLKVRLLLICLVNLLNKCFCFSDY